MSHNTLLKTREVAEAMGVSVSTIKRWVDDGAITATRTVGKHRLIPVSEALRFAREQELPHARLQILLDMEGGEPHFSTETAVDSLTEALVQGLAGEAKVIIGSMYAKFREAPRLADDLIRPVMERIGQRWQDGTLDIYEEHRASRIVESALTEIIARVSATPSQTGALAIGAAPEGDLSTLPGYLCELTLRELGWDVANLGPNLPLASLANAVRVHRPRLVWLSINHIGDREQFIRDYQILFEATSATGTASCLGGNALTPDLKARLVAASFGERLAHLAEFARRLVPVMDRKPGQSKLIPLSPRTITNEG